MPTRRTLIRLAAAAALLAILWQLVASGLPEVAALGALLVALTAVAVRPPKPPNYAPTYWTRKDLGG